MDSMYKVTVKEHTLNVKGDSHEVRDIFLVASTYSEVEFAVERIYDSIWTEILKIEKLGDYYYKYLSESNSLEWDRYLLDTND